MTRKQLLEDAIQRIARWRGIEDTSVFTIVPVSRDCAGVVIMATQWPEGGRLYRELKTAVRSFPEAADATCVALLPAVVDEIIATSRVADDQTRPGPAPEVRGRHSHTGTSDEAAAKVARLPRDRTQQAALLAPRPGRSDATPGGEVGDVREEACG